jgi:thioredoxin 1
MALDLEGRDRMANWFRSLFGKQEEKSKNKPPAAGAATPLQVQEAQPVQVTDDTFEEVVLNSSLPVVVDFWAPWCGPCRMVAPVVEDLARAYAGRALVAKLNTDESVETPSQLGIMGIPTLVFFRSGQEVDRIVGFASRRLLEEKLQALLG